MSDAGEGGYFTEAVGKWKMVRFQCGYLFLLKKVATLQQMVEDTSLTSQRFGDLKERLRTVTGDVKATKEENEELESSLRVLREDDDRLGRQGTESQQLLSAETKKNNEAYSCTVLWTQSCQRQESKTQAAEADASELRQQNKTLQESVKDLSESVRDIESELEREKCQTRAV